jgi:S-formylglutathione hydrolase
MKKILFFLLLSLSFNAYSQERGTLITDYIDSQSMKNNIFGDSSLQKIFVYLPKSYAHSQKSYPVLYYLTGFRTEIDWMIDGTFQGLKMDRTLDSLISNNKINEMIVVIVTAKVNLFDTGKRWGTFYTNSPINGNWEDFIARDLVGFIDSKYRTIKNRNSRGISGHSMGGYGTIRLSLLHPDIFGYAYALSMSTADPSNCENPFFINKESINKLAILNEELIKSDTSILLYKKIITDSDKDNSFFIALAYGASFVPREDKKTPFVEYPVILKNSDTSLDKGKLLKWQTNGLGILSRIMESNSKNPAKLNELILDIGLEDWNVFIDGITYTSKLLSNNKVCHRTLFYNGDHSNKLRSRIEEYLLPYFSSVLVEK